jgi:TonB family protein
MKRSIFAATLALTPSLLLAQAASPSIPSAQPVLQARAASPADIKSGNPEPSKAKTAGASTARVSTGIVAPKMIQAISLSSLPGTHNHLLAKDITVVVQFVVEPTGKTENASIAQSGGEGIDKEVLEAIREAHFQPGTLDGQPFAVPVRLEVLVQRGAQY